MAGQPPDPRGPRSIRGLSVISGDDAQDRVHAHRDRAQNTFDCVSGFPDIADALHPPPSRLQFALVGILGAEDRHQALQFLLQLLIAVIPDEVAQFLERLVELTIEKIELIYRNTLMLGKMNRIVIDMMDRSIQNIDGMIFDLFVVDVDGIDEVRAAKIRSRTWIMNS